VGLCWIAIASLPIVVVVKLWSAYYYAFAVCGFGIVLGDLLRKTSWIGASAVVASVLVGSASARQVATYGVPIDAWSSSSHINTAYVSRSEQYIHGFDPSLRRALPVVPAKTTFFFANVPGSIAWQVADGPYVRWAFRDSTLRAFYLSDLTEDKLGRGPVFLFVAEGDTLRNVSHDRSVVWGLALRAMLQQDMSVFRGALTYYLSQFPDDTQARYALAWGFVIDRDFANAEGLLRSIGIHARPGQFGESYVSDVANAIARSDTASAVQQLGAVIAVVPYDQRAHSLLADLSLRSPTHRQRGILEAFASVAIAPENPKSWRRWAYVQATSGEIIGALHSIERYKQLDPTQARTDTLTLRMETALRRVSENAPSKGQVSLRPPGP
jgi:hypothetical protein